MGSHRTSSKGAKRQQAKQMEQAVAAISLGVALLVVPLILGSPIVKGLASGLRIPGLIALAVGVVLLLAARRSSQAQGEPPRATARNLARPVRPAAPAPEARGQQSGYLPEDASPEDEAKNQEPACAMWCDAASPPTTPAAWGSDVFDLIEWRRFEAVCEALFVQAGFEARSQSHGADGGIDIWLFSKNHPDGPVSVVQCKHWKQNRPVKVGEVRALLGAMTDKKVGRGIFATTSGFTQDARALAANNKIQLLDRKGLLDLIGKRSPEQQQRLLAVATEGEYWVPTCASCGVKMVRRQQKKGANAGREFWGCRNYPRCRNRLNGALPVTSSASGPK